MKGVSTFQRFSLIAWTSTWRPSGNPSSGSVFEFTHIIGESPCVQLVGMVTIRNVAQNRVAATVSVTAPLLLRGIGDLVREGSVGIEANQIRQFEVFFDCTQRKDFEGSVRISDGTARVAVIPVVGHVR